MTKCKQIFLEETSQPQKVHVGLRTTDFCNFNFPFSPCYRNHFPTHDL